MSEDDDVEICCPTCSAVVDYDTACPNGCDPLSKYLVGDVYKNIAEKDWDALGSISLNETIELVNKSLEDNESSDV
jgi:hypothetical protein